MIRHHFSASSWVTASKVRVLVACLSIGTAPSAAETNNPRQRLEKK
jgi:hypothetical protein